MRMPAATITAAYVAFVVLSVVPCSAQVQRGAIYGTVRDATGAVLPGTLLHLTSAFTAPQEMTAGDRGRFRFPDLDPGAYTLRARLDGFAPVVRENILVGVGVSVELHIEMVLGHPAEEVTVAAATPVLDVRRQDNVTNFDQVMLNEIPTARDPWALMQHLPGVSIARPNVGGSESTNQAQFAARGDNGSNTMWNIEGARPGWTSPPRSGTAASCIRRANGHNTSRRWMGAGLAERTRSSSGSSTAGRHRTKPWDGRGMAPLPSSIWRQSACRRGSGSRT